MDTTLSGQAGDMFSPPELYLEAYQDGIAEQLEGFVLLLEINESELDPRDVGNVSLSRSVYLVRINQSGITPTIHQIIISLTGNRLIPYIIEPHAWMMAMIIVE